MVNETSTGTVFVTGRARLAPCGVDLLGCRPCGPNGNVLRRHAVSYRSPSEVIFEFHTIGGSVKVTAVDPETFTEVSIVGAANASEELLRRTALRKLEYVLNKSAGSPAQRR